MHASMLGHSYVLRRPLLSMAGCLLNTDVEPTLLHNGMHRLEYIMLKITNYSFQQFFLFNPLFPKLFSVQSITNLYCYVKNYNISYLNKKSKKDLWFSQLAKGIFSELRCYRYE